MDSNSNLLTVPANMKAKRKALYKIVANIHIRMPKELLDSDGSDTESDDKFGREIQLNLSGLNKKIMQNIKKYARPQGLRNPGHTCFMNSIIQIMDLTADIRSFFSSSLESDTHEDNIVSVFRRIIQKMSNPNNFTIADIDTFRNNILKIEEFKSFNTQSDSHEFLVTLLDQLHKKLCKVDVEDLQELNKKTDQMDTVISDCFRGKKERAVTCFDCHNTTFTNEVFNYLGVNILEERSNTSNSSLVPIKSLNETSITECFSTRTEEIFENDDNLYYCDKCRKKTKAKKIDYITKLPKYLILQANKYNWDPEKKLNSTTKITYDLNMDLYTQSLTEQKEKFSYELYGVVIHFGSVQERGHYRRYGKYYDDKWYDFYDDGLVVPIDNIEKLQNDGAYLLFYKRVQKE